MAFLIFLSLNTVVWHFSVLSFVCNSMLWLEVLCFVQPYIDIYFISHFLRIGLESGCFIHDLYSLFLPF